jgi:hypothetical protein
LWTELADAVGRSSGRRADGDGRDRSARHGGEACAKGPQMMLEVRKRFVKLPQKA